MPHKTLVTGSEGLVGCALKEILPQAVFVSRKEGDLTDADKTRELFAKVKPSHVIHLAAETGGVEYNRRHNAELLTSNLKINTNVLEAAHACGVRRLVAALCSCAFPVKPDGVCREEDLHQGLPYEGHLGYGYSKRALDIQIHLANRQYDREYSSVTPVTIYGPNDNWNPEESHVVSALIAKCRQAKLERNPLEVWGSGQAVRQFIYSYDVARLLVELLETYTGPGTMIAAPPEKTSIRALAEAIARVMDFKQAIAFNADRPEGQKMKLLEGERFLKFFPRFRFTPLEEGLRLTADWFLKHSNAPQKNHAAS